MPELSRRARGVPVWAALRSLGRAGVVALVERLADLAPGARGRPRGDCRRVEVLNDVVYTQVCLSFGGDERTRLVTERLLADGVTWMSGSRWHGRAVLRISVSNWTTDAEDIAKSVAAVERASAPIALPARREGGAASARASDIRPFSTSEWRAPRAIGQSVAFGLVILHVAGIPGGRTRSER